MNSRLIITYLVLVAFLGLIAFAYITRSTNTKYVAMEGKEFEEKVKAVIAQNPELILEAVMNFQEREASVEREKAEQSIKDVYKKIIADKDLTHIGKGKVKVVEFYDYGCGYCKSMASIKKEYSKNGVEFILIEHPVLGEGSSYLARAAIAMQILAPKKFHKIHFTILEDKGSGPKMLVKKLLDKYEIDPEKFKETMRSEKVKSKLKKMQRYAKEAGIYAAPAYIINGKLYMGAFPEPKFREIIEQNSK